MEGGVPDVMQSTNSLTSSLSVMLVSTLLQFLYQRKNITSNRFVLDMIKVLLSSV